MRERESFCVGKNIRIQTFENLTLVGPVFMRLFKQSVHRISVAFKVVKGY